MKPTNYPSVLACTAGLLLSACSAQSVYEGSHQYRADQCAKLPEPEYGQCLAEARKPYGEHRKEYDDQVEDK